MLRRFRLSLLLLALAGCSSSGRSARPVDLRVLALQPRDLRGSVLAGPARYWSNEQAARRDGVAVSSYNAHGRIRSYQNSYTPNFASRRPVALQRAGSEVTAYKDVQGAHWGWTQLGVMWQRGRVIGSTTLGTPSGQAGIPVPFKAIAVPRIGDEDAGYSVTWGGDEFDYTTTAILFRQGRYVASVTVIGIMGQVPLRTLVDMARAVDRRLVGRTS